MPYKLLVQHRPEAQDLDLCPRRVPQDLKTVPSSALQADYGLMVFADMRYQRHDKRDKLPSWITSHLKDAHLNLSTDMLLHVARQFMRSMGQPYPKMDVGKSLLTEAQVRRGGHRHWRDTGGL